MTAKIDASNLANIRLQGVTEASAGMQASPEIIAQHVRLRMGNYVRRYVSVMKEEAPRGMTGKLREGIGYRIEENPGVFQAIISSKAPYTTWVVNGRGEVRPIRAHCLHWVQAGGWSGQAFVRSGPVEVFAMRSGPTKPNNFPGRAKARMGGEYSSMATKMLSDITRDIAQYGQGGGGVTNLSGISGAAAGAGLFSDAFSRMASRLAGRAAQFIESEYL